MKNIIIVSCLLFLVGCSQTKMVKDEVIQLKGNNQLLQVNYEICNDYKSNSAKVYGCSSSFSKDVLISFISFHLSIDFIKILLKSFS